LRHIYVNYHNRINTEEQYLHLHKKTAQISDFSQ
jgi:hypothetical protein